MKKLFFILYSVFFIALGTSAFAAVVNNIVVEGNRRMDAESVRIMADVRLGDNITLERRNEIAKRLQMSGLFARASVVQSAGTLTISVSESPVVNMVTIEGNNRISNDDLRREIRIRERSPFDESVIGADVQRMLTLYQRQGFFGTQINPKRIDIADGRVNVVFEITEGHPTRIRRINFTGNRYFSGRQLRSAMLSNEWSRFRPMASFDTFDEDRIQFDQHQLRQFYMQNGFINFRILNVSGEFSADRRWYSVNFEVEEGTRFRFGTIEIDNPFPDVDTADLRRLVVARSGRWYNIDHVEETISRLRSRVAEYGYAFIHIDVVPTLNEEARTIDLIFRIAPTNRMYINQIAILGNVRTFDSVIEHQLQVRPGDPFSRQELELGRQRMMRTRYFSAVDMIPTRIPDTNLMNLDVRVEEQPTGELSGGLGWSNINGFMIDAGITENNFMGRGQTVQLRASYAQFQQQLMFSFTEPHLWGRALSAGFDINYTMFNYARLGSMAYDRDSFMVAGRLGWRLTENWTQMMRLSAMFDQNRDMHINDGQWQSVQLYTLGTTFRYHNLTSNFQQQTHTGIVGNLSIAYTGFGSSETFMRYDAGITGLLKFLDDRWQLRSELNVGLLQPLTSDEYISRMYRYFLGGESLRGFAIAGVGGRLGYSHYATGGLWRIHGTTQVNFPIFIPDQYQVRGFLFLDYGILGRPPLRQYQELAASQTPPMVLNIDQDLRAAWGWGVFWNTPMGPMNFSWGYPIRSHPYDRGQRFLLSFATQF